MLESERKLYDTEKSRECSQINNTSLSVKNYLGDFSGGRVDKNPPADAGDTGSIPGAGRSYVGQSS